MVARRAFGLVEVIVAMTLLGIGVISIGAGAAFATKIMRLAETEERAAHVAAAILDSLAFLPEWTAGSLTVGRLQAQWPAGVAGSDARIDITVASDPALSYSFMTTVPPALRPLSALPDVRTDSTP